MASADGRRFGPFAVHHPDPRMRDLMLASLAHADHGRAAWPLAGRALVSGTPVVINGIEPGEFEGIVNPAMDAYIESAGLSAVAFLPMRAPDGVKGVLGMARGPGR